MTTQKIRCPECYKLVAELDGDRLTFDLFRRPRRGRDADEWIPRSVTLGIDDDETKSMAAGGLVAVCQGDCDDQPYPLAQLVVTATESSPFWQVSGRSSPESGYLTTSDDMMLRNFKLSPANPHPL